jgi:hypothetical protein
MAKFIQYVNILGVHYSSIPLFPNPDSTVLGTESRALLMLCEYSTIGLYPQPNFVLCFKKSWIILKKKSRLRDQSSKPVCKRLS